jgi:lipoyl-dependent peroxiredoxin
MAIAQRTSIAERSAQTVWTGPLQTGQGTVTTGSGALDLPVTWAARTQRPHGMTSPEELAAAAHASCFSMALALRLGEHNITPQRLEVTATVSLADIDGRPTVV